MYSARSYGEDLDQYVACSFCEDSDVKLDSVVGELVELGKVFGKVLVREEVPPLATLEDNMDVSVAVLVAPPVPAASAVVKVSKMVVKARKVPQTTGRGDSAGL